MIGPRCSVFGGPGLPRGRVRLLLLSLLWFAAASPALPQALDFSADGKLIAYSWPGSGQPVPLMVAAIVNGVLPKGTPPAALADRCEPKWSPDGHYVVCQQANAARTAELYDATTGGTKDLGVSIGSPYAWREDGQRFAGIRTLDAGQTEAVWYGLPQSGVTLHVALPIASAVTAVWLPNTDDIALLGVGPEGPDVYTVEAGEVHRVTTSHDVIGLALSADHKKLVWARTSPNTRYILFSVYAYDLKERSVVRLPFPNRVPALNPDPRHAPRSVDDVRFSPDGSRLAVLATFDQQGTKLGTRAVYVMGMDGSAARQVVRLPAPTAEPDSRVLVPRWSRDGKTLGMIQGIAGAAVLNIYDADGSNPRTIARQ